MSEQKKYKPSHLAGNNSDCPKTETVKKNRKMEKTEKTKRRSVRVPKAAGVTIVILFLIMAGCYFTFHYFYSRLNISAKGEELQFEAEDDWKNELSDEVLSDIDKYLQENLENEVDWDYAAADVMNILLIGVDNDYAPSMNDRGNADGLIIVSINRTTKQVVLTSLMRDIYVSVPAGYNTKITLSYHYGGTQVLIDTIEKNFGIPVDNYILVNYLNIVELVDAVGGLYMDVTSDELFWMESKIKNLNQLMDLPEEANLIDPSEAGRLLLNGVQIAAYMRIRYAGDGDFDRTERAREVLLGLKDRAMEMSATELLNFANTVLPMITTDLSQSQTLSLITNAPTYMGYDMVSNRIPIDDSWYFADINGSVVVIDFPANREFLYRSVYDGDIS